MALFQYWSKLCESLVGDGADAEQVEVGEVHLRLGVEILVAEVASAYDGRRAVGQPQLVVHAPVLLGQVEQAADASRDAGGAAQVQRVEQAHLDVRMGGEHTDLVVPAIAGGVVDEDAYPHATVGCLEQLVGEGARGQSVVDDVVLDVEAALGCANQRRAGDEGILAGAQEVEAGLAGVVASLDFGLPGQPGTLGGQCRRRLRRRSAGAAGEGQEGQQEESAKQGYLPWKLERPAHPGRANSRSFPRKSDAPPDFFRIHRASDGLSYRVFPSAGTRPCPAPAVASAAACRRGR